MPFMSQGDRLLVVFAHPDDAEINLGGLAAKYVASGGTVRFLSLTNGATGHHEMGGRTLATRRRQEANEAAEVLGVEYDIWDEHTGELRPSLHLRKRLIEEIRTFDPDLVITHSTDDYHPDHRATGELIRDASYIVTVPNMCPLTPPLESPPVIATASTQLDTDIDFQRDVVVAIDDVVEQKFEALHCHTSQVYEWLPYTENNLDAIPESPEARREWLRDEWAPKFRRESEEDELLAKYYPDRHDEISFTEAFAISPYGRTPEEVDKLFALSD
jgi:LmbE family N-acetylglucosaminyl deacetylase